MSHSEENGPLRRHTGFWQVFNTWYRTQITAGGDRPVISKVHAWYDNNSASVWGNKHTRPTLQEALLHANGLRSAEEVKKYNRSYKSKKTMFQTAASHKSKQIQQSSTSEHTVDRASITSGMVGDIEGLASLIAQHNEALAKRHEMSSRLPSGVNPGPQVHNRKAGGMISHLSQRTSSLTSSATTLEDPKHKQQQQQQQWSATASEDPQHKQQQQQQPHWSATTAEDPQHKQQQQEHWSVTTAEDPRHKQQQQQQKQQHAQQQKQQQQWSATTAEDPRHKQQQQQQKQQHTQQRQQQQQQQWSATTAEYPQHKQQQHKQQWAGHEVSTAAAPFQSKPSTPQASPFSFNMTNLPPFVLPTVTSGDRCKPYRADSFNSADDSESLPSSSQQLPESFGLGQQASATHYGLASQQPSSSQQLPEYFGLGQRASASHYGSASQQPSSSQQLPEPFGLGRRASAFFYGLASLEPETLAQRPSALTCNSSLPATISGVASYHLDTCGLDLPGGALTCNGFLPATISGVASHQLDTYGLDPPGGAITYNSSLPASSYGGMPPQLDTSGHVQRSSASQYNLVPPTSLLLSPFTNSHKVSFRMIPCMPAQPVASTSWYPPLRVGPPLRVVSIIESGASQTDEPCTSWKRSFSDQLSNAQNKRSRRESTTSVFGPESLSSVVKGPNQRTSYVITTSLSSVHAASVPSSSFSLDDYVL